MTAEELIAATWRFRFRMDHEALHMTDAERLVRGRERSQARLSFDATGHYSSTIPGAPSALRPLRWRLLRGARGETSVQIGAYPLLTVGRTSDWGWTMSNRFVEFFTAASAP